MDLEKEPLAKELDIFISFFLIISAIVVFSFLIISKQDRDYIRLSAQIDYLERKISIQDSLSTEKLNSLLSAHDWAFSSK